VENPLSLESFNYWYWKALRYGSALVAIVGTIFIYYPTFRHNPIIDQGRIAYFLLPLALTVVISSIITEVVPVRMRVIEKYQAPTIYWCMVAFYLFLLGLDVGYIGYRIL
jgi:hypothetical protein